MKQLFNRKSVNGKLTKGMPSAVMLSILIHAALFLLAGMLVVFTVVKKEEKKFTPPKAVERPKMKLKKPKVTVKKTSKPKPTTRIVTKVNRASMPDIQLPEMSSMGDGLGDVVGGFDMMPDLDEITVYGSGQSIGNDLIGTFYDSKRDRQGRTLPVDTTGNAWRSMIHKFLVRGWDTSVFSRYHRALQKLYATNLVVPLTRSALAPLAFGDEESVGALWMVHYKGQLVCPVTHVNGITFRFWGMADEFLMIRLNGRLVLATAWVDHNQNQEGILIGTLWKSDSADSRKYYTGSNTAVVGDWITLEPGESLEMEMLIGDNGGRSAFFLAVEEEGVEYEKNRQGAPILPAFRTAELSHDLLDSIYKNLPEGEMICLTNGPVFCDYDTSGAPVAAEEPEQPVQDPASRIPQPVTPKPTANPESSLRTWILADGRTLVAEFINIFGGKVVLKDATGKMRKIPKGNLSTNDIEYAELASPPDLDINFLKNFKHVEFSGGFYDVGEWYRPPEEWGHCGLQIKQTSVGKYDHELQIEMFVVGKQWRRSKYIFLDHQKTTFNPARTEQRFHEFRSDRKVVIALDDWGSRVGGEQYVLGEKYYGYLITITDERGEVVAMKSSHKWLTGILENLRKLSAGNFFDETGVHTYPDRQPPSTRY